MRKRILDVLRFGTPMAGGYESMVFCEKQPAGCVMCCKSYIVPTA
jgi:hypothetical protein